MNQEIKAFLNKFIASLSMHGVEKIPFSGSEFDEGISAIKNVLLENLKEKDYKLLADIFIQVPVQENYQQVKTMFMGFNGHGISFAGADNPFWETMSIKMNAYSAKRILADNTVLNFDEHFMSEVIEAFCEAAGVPIWEEF